MLPLLINAPKLTDKQARLLRYPGHKLQPGVAGWWYRRQFQRQANTLLQTSGALTQDRLRRVGHMANQLKQKWDTFPQFPPSDSISTPPPKVSTFSQERVGLLIHPQSETEQTQAERLVFDAHCTAVAAWLRQHSDYLPNEAALLLDKNPLISLVETTTRWRDLRRNKQQATQPGLVLASPQSPGQAWLIIPNQSPQKIVWANNTIHWPTETDGETIALHSPQTTPTAWAQDDWPAPNRTTTIAQTVISHSDGHHYPPTPTHISTTAVELRPFGPVEPDPTWPMIARNPRTWPTIIGNIIMYGSVHRQGLEDVALRHTNNMARMLLSAGWSDFPQVTLPPHLTPKT